MTALPRDASLDAALALGGIRVATAAHPFCRCHKPKPPLPKLNYKAKDRARAQQSYDRRLAAWKAEHGSPRAPNYQRRECPVHVGTAGGA